MSTDNMLYPAQDLTLGLNGNVPVAVLEHDPCCTDPLCTNEVATMCSFIDILPTGPLWDKSKSDLREIITECGGIPLIDSDCWTDRDCTSMTFYAAYMGQVLSDMVQNILRPSIRESDPRTAVATLDDWLERFGWIDCYSCTCSQNYASDLSPYRRVVEWGCLTCCCPPILPDDFQCALKYGLVQSLNRMRRGVIKNLDGINWVIAPLGAAIRPRAYPDHIQAYIDGTCDDDVPPCFCEDVALEIYPTTETLTVCPTAENLCSNEPLATVAAQQVYFCEEEREEMACEGYDACLDERTRIYPAVIAAECLIRSMLPRQCPNIIFRDETVVDRREYP